MKITVLSTLSFWIAQLVQLSDSIGRLDEFVDDDWPSHNAVLGAGPVYRTKRQAEDGSLNPGSGVSQEFLAGEGRSRGWAVGVGNRGKGDDPWSRDTGNSKGKGGRWSRGWSRPVRGEKWGYGSQWGKTKAKSRFKSQGKGNRRGTGNRDSQPWSDNRCSGLRTLYATVGSRWQYLESPNVGSRYNDNSWCQWRIYTQDTDYKIRIQFDLFALEQSSNCYRDSLTIYDGSTNSARKIGTYCGYIRPPDITSTGQYLYIEFKSDDRDNNYGGFRMMYGAVRGQGTSQVNSCSSSTVIMTAPEGTVQSPRYPGRYPNDQRCSWRIQAEAKCIIRIEFTSLDLAPQRVYGCDDHVKIYDGSTENSVILRTLCAFDRQPAAFYSTSNNVFIQFTSDRGGTGEGFHLRYKAECPQIQPTEDPFTRDLQCPKQTLQLRETSGTITTPGYPNSNFPDGADCKWKITASKRCTIDVKLTNIDIESSSDCIDGGLFFYNKNKKPENMLGRICGLRGEPREIRASTNAMLIHFQSKRGGNNRGFQLDYTTQCPTSAPTCPFEPTVYTGPSGSITSPGWPDRYPNNADCMYHIVLDAGCRVALEAERFTLHQADERNQCTADFMSVYDGSNDDAPLLGTYCGQQRQLNLAATRNEMFIHFVSDSRGRRAGFELTYKGLCGNQCDNCQWGVWSRCSSSCKRLRSWNCPSGATGCQQNPVEEQDCSPGQGDCRNQCDDCQWGMWSRCSSSCKRQRSWNCPSGATGCQQNPVEEQDCSPGQGDCPNLCNNCQWSVWSRCSSSCKRQRSWNCPSGATGCQQNPVDEQDCSPGQGDCRNPCDDCSFGSFSACSSDCKKRRSWVCPQGATSCQQRNDEVLDCSPGEGNCPSCAKACSWSAWTACQASPNCSRSRVQECGSQTGCPEAPQTEKCTGASGCGGTGEHAICGQQQVIRSRVIGGVEVYPHEYPWVVQMRILHPAWGEINWCGASLLSKDWIITATHCTYFRDHRNNEVNLTAPEHLHRVTFMLGEHNVTKEESTETRHSVSLGIVHPNHNPITYLNDLTLFKLATPAKFNTNVQPICLPSGPVVDDKEYIIAGWGMTEPPNTDPTGRSASQVLMKAEIWSFNRSVCNQVTWLDRRVQDGMFCAGQPDGSVDSCQGDSGGPLFSKDPTNNAFELHGLVSWGLSCAVENKPGVYTDVYYYLDWITKQMESH